MIERDLVIVGDEAWLPEEYEAEQRRVDNRRQTWREYALRNRDKRIAYLREWQASHPEEVRAARRRWAAKHRRHPVGSLHGLACSGPTRATGCRCSKITMYDKP